MYANDFSNKLINLANHYRVQVDHDWIITMYMWRRLFLHPPIIYSLSSSYSSVSVTLWLEKV